MRKITILIIALLFLSFFNITLFSQNENSERIIKKMHEYSYLMHFQKLYLHTDRDVYFSNDTIWFSAWLLDANSHQLDKLEKIMYVDVVFDDNQVLANYLFEIKNGRSYGQIEIPYFQNDIKLKIKAYTNYMLNSGEEFLFYKAIDVLSEVLEDEDSDGLDIRYAKNEESDKKLFSIISEGGNVLYGTTNRMIFLSEQIKSQFGKIVDEDENVVAFINSDENGRAQFSFIPIQGKKYFFEYDKTDGSRELFPVEIKSNSDYSLYVNNNLQNGFFDIIINSVSSNEEEVNLVVTQSGKVVHAISFVPQQGANSIRLKKEDFHTGIVQVVVLDSGLDLLCERMVFVNNDDFLSFEIDTEETDRGVEFTIDVLDKDGASSMGDFAISINPVVDDSVIISSEKSLAKYIYMESDIPSLSNKNINIFRNDISTKRQVDLLMASNRWERYLWQNVLADTIPNPEYLLETNFYLRGVVNSMRKNPKPVPNCDVTFMGSGKSVFAGNATTNINGQFIFQLEDFSDTLDIIVQTKNKHERKKDYDLTLSTNLGKTSFGNLYDLIDVSSTYQPVQLKNSMHDAIEYQKALYQKIEEDKQSEKENKLSSLSDITLEEVEVTARRKLSLVEKLHVVYGEETDVLSSIEVEEIASQRKWHYGLFSLLDIMYPEINVISERWGAVSEHEYLLPPLLSNLDQELEDRSHLSYMYSFKRKGAGRERFYFYVDGRLSAFTNHKGHLEWAIAGISTLEPEHIKSIGVIKNLKRSPLQDAITEAKMPNEIYSPDFLYSYIINSYPEAYLEANDIIISVQTKGGAGIGGMVKNKGIYKSRVYGFAPQKDFTTKPALMIGERVVYAPTIYWNPSVQLVDGKVKFDIEKQYLPKKFTISIVGISDDGLPGEEKFEIELGKD